MASLLWKAFDFFEVSQVKLAATNGNATSPDDDAQQTELLSLLENNEVSCLCSGSDSLFLGSDDGRVRIVGPSWKILRAFIAHDVGRITHMRQVEGTSLLVTVAEDLISEPVLKVWALDKPVKKTGLPTCLSTVSITNGRKQFPISAFAALDDLSQLAVGFANGAVTVIRGDLIHDRGTKQRIVHESEEPITGVEFVADSRLTTLFVATTAKLLKLVISGRGQGQTPRTVEDQGCAAGCMTLNRETGDIIVARDDAVYYYTLDGRGLCFANSGPTALIDTYRDYVAQVRNGDPNNVNGRFGANTESIFNASSFTMVDPSIQIVAHSESLISPVKNFFQIWGDVFILTQDGKIHRYHEKSLQQRLELLYQRNLYPLALNLAQKSGMDGKQQNVIYRKYGDHLYQKGDYDNAMSQYIRAIDSTEPSQVIRKFLDTQRIHNLVEYLEELHEHRKATADHTTLLLNCYAKLKDVEKLEKFIKSPGDLKFDLDTAISMCRQGGYYEQAAYLATKHGENDLVVDILVEDSRQYAEALDFIWHLEAEVAYACLMKYARVLLEYCPKETTQLFIDYYTGKYRPRVRVAAPEAPAAPGGLAAAASAVQNLTSLLPLPYMTTTSVQTNGQASQNGLTQADAETLPVSKYTPPQPRTAFSSFIDHADEFIVFLEACLQEPSLGQGAASTDLHTTLFEMYLHKAGERRGVQGEKEEWEAKAKKLIQSRGDNDNDDEGKDQPTIGKSDVLLLSHLADFSEGTTLVKEQSGLLFDIFRAHTAARDTRGALRALRRYGPREPRLYPAALAYLTSPTLSSPRSEADVDIEAELSHILERIDTLRLMAPLQVVQQLASSPLATVGLVRPYLADAMARERREIAANRRQAAGFRAETEAKRAELADLERRPAFVQAQRCAACGGALDLPTVHFLCRHSFHQRCMKGGSGGGGQQSQQQQEEECPVCAPQNAAVRAMKRGQEEAAGRHDLFRDALEKSGSGADGEDRFKTVAAWFGRGVMNSGADAS